MEMENELIHSRVFLKKGGCAVPRLVFSLGSLGRKSILDQ